MAYLSDSLKKEYHANTDVQRVKNLKKLREDIAELSLTAFSQKIGITKNDISRYETGEKTLSLFSILAYKKYFYENHKINLSIDFIMGFTDIQENSNLNYQNEISLSNDAINTLKALRKSRQNLSDVINRLLSDENKAIALFSNIKMIISENDTWMPCVAICSDDEENATFEMLDQTQHLGFYTTDVTGGNYALLIDESILKSHSVLKIKEILDSYKGDDK